MPLHESNHLTRGYSRLYLGKIAVVRLIFFFLFVCFISNLVSSIICALRFVKKTFRVRVPGTACWVRASDFPLGIPTFFYCAEMKAETEEAWHYRKQRFERVRPQNCSPRATRWRRLSLVLRQLANSSPSPSLQCAHQREGRGQGAAVGSCSLTPPRGRSHVDEHRSNAFEGGPPIERGLSQPLSLSPPFFFQSSCSRFC